uniref:Uncharacterized protein n=1 Tax=Romanomermis culicivorax TaxID=13658 RepID=A0A915I4A2_ROMCU
MFGKTGGCAITDQGVFVSSVFFMHGYLCQLAQRTMLEILPFFVKSQQIWKSNLSLISFIFRSVCCNYVLVY